MKHYIKKWKKDSWRVQNVKCSSHEFVQKCSKYYKMHISIFKTIQWLSSSKPWAWQ